MLHRISLSLIVGLTLFVFTVIQVSAQVSFFADFEDNSKKAVPNKGVNDAANWKPENAGQKWGLAKFANGTQGLQHTTSGCGNSGNTPLPGNITFTDGVIEVDAAWKDDDSWGIIFRQTAPDKGYLAFFGYNETPRVILADLAKGCGKMGQCLNEGTNCEENRNLVIADEPHKLGGGLDQSGNVIYKLKVEANGNHIKLSYGKLGEEKVIVDVKDDTYKRGSVGIWQESNDNSMIDNVKITGGLAVNPQWKLATMWSWLKTQY